jgi:rubrerythrin
MFSLEDVVALAIQIEKNAEKVLREASKKASNPSLASLLKWLADEELKHAERFSELKGTETKTPHDPQVEALGKSLLKGILADQTFSLKDVDFSSMDQVQQVLNAAIEFEEDTVLFYEMLRSFMKEKEDLEHLDAIIEEEKIHIQRLQDFAAKPMSG